MIFLNQRTNQRDFADLTYAQLSLKIGNAHVSADLAGMDFEDFVDGLDEKSGVKSAMLAFQDRQEELDRKAQIEDQIQPHQTAQQGQSAYVTETVKYGVWSSGDAPWKLGDAPRMSPQGDYTENTATFEKMTHAGIPQDVKDLLGIDDNFQRVDQQRQNEEEVDLDDLDLSDDLMAQTYDLDDSQADLDGPEALQRTQDAPEGTVADTQDQAQDVRAVQADSVETAIVDEPLPEMPAQSQAVAMQAPVVEPVAETAQAATQEATTGPDLDPALVELAQNSYMSKGIVYDKDGNDITRETESLHGQIEMAPLPEHEEQALQSLGETLQAENDLEWMNDPKKALAQEAAQMRTLHNQNTSDASTGNTQTLQQKLDR